MLNPFDVNSHIIHCPKDVSKAFEEISENSCNTESLLASKSKTFLSSNSEKRAPISLWQKSLNQEEEKALHVADLASTDTFAISKSSEQEISIESKTSKPPRSVQKDMTVQEKEEPHSKTKGHCKTCKCLNISSSTIKPFAESESLKYLSKLGSVPNMQREGNAGTGKVVFMKPYTSPLFSNSIPPSQIFRQRINNQILNARLSKQVSLPVFKLKDCK